MRLVDLILALGVGIYLGLTIQGIIDDRAMDLRTTALQVMQCTKGNQAK